MPKQLPILFACSGCSNVGQLTDHLARELDRRGIAEMLCLAGVGAAKPHFLKKLAQREVWIVDGCPIACSLGVFAQLGEHIDVHIRPHDLDVRKDATLPTGPTSRTSSRPRCDKWRSRSSPRRVPAITFQRCRPRKLSPHRSRIHVLQRYPRFGTSG